MFFLFAAVIIVTICTAVYMENHNWKLALLIAAFFISYFFIRLVQYRNQKNAKSFPASAGLLKKRTPLAQGSLKETFPYFPPLPLRFKSCPDCSELRTTVCQLAADFAASFCISISFRRRI